MPTDAWRINNLHCKKKIMSLDKVSNKKFFENVLLFERKNKPFILYRKPFECDLTFHSGRTTSKDFRNISDNSFFLIPFNNKKGYVIKNEITIKTKYVANKRLEKSNKTPSNFLVSETEKNSYLRSIKELVKKIKQKKLLKIVFSKKFSFKYPKSNCLKTFKKILDSYDDAFCYMFFHPDQGYWVGASPELLFEKQNENLTTMALAGSKFIKSESWTKKEIEEQKIVKDEIYENLKPICSSLEIGETVTVSAGKIQHLKTEFKGTSGASCQEIVDVLFPTSAIAGLPKDEAFAEISRSENHDRSFYSGFLGQIENDRSFSFVNLRCFNLKSDVLSLYVGSGITQKSDPEKEWKEILKKSETMLNALF